NLQVHGRPSIGDSERRSHRSFKSEYWEPSISHGFQISIDWMESVSLYKRCPKSSRVETSINMHLKRLNKSITEQIVLLHVTPDYNLLDQLTVDRVAARNFMFQTAIARKEHPKDFFEGFGVGDWEDHVQPHLSEYSVRIKDVHPHTILKIFVELSKLPEYKGSLLEAAVQHDFDTYTSNEHINYDADLDLVNRSDDLYSDGDDFEECKQDIKSDEFG
ncbi:hypothetical protein MAR_000847, partial [Mya arenaria]